MGDIPPTWDDNVNPFDLWQHKGRRIWSAIKPQQAREMMENLMPSLRFTEHDLPEEETLAILSQKIVFDLMGPGTTKGNYEVIKRMRSLQADQINSKLLWLRQASCRGYELDVTTLSEPIPSFWLGLLLSEARLGWSRVLNGFARLLSSLRGDNFSGCHWRDARANLDRDGSRSMRIQLSQQTNGSRSQVPKHSEPIGLS